MLPTCSFYQQNFSFNLKISTVLPVNGQLIIPRTLTKYRLPIEIFGRGRKKTQNMYWFELSGFNEKFLLN